MTPSATQSPSRPRGTYALLVGVILLIIPFFATPAHPQSSDQDPPLAPGRPPGGLPVAIVGLGLDYRLPKIAACIARDGEGVPIAWDLVDENPLPFATQTAETALGLSLCSNSKVALVVTRYDTSARLGLQSAIGFVLQTPARIVMVAVDKATADLERLLKLAALSVNDRLYVAMVIGPAANTFQFIVVASNASNGSAQPQILKLDLTTDVPAADAKTQPTEHELAWPAAHAAGLAIAYVAEAWSSHAAAAPHQIVEALRQIADPSDAAAPVALAKLKNLDNAVKAALQQPQTPAEPVQKDTPQ